MGIALAVLGIGVTVAIGGGAYWFLKTARAALIVTIVGAVLAVLSLIYLSPLRVQWGGDDDDQMLIPTQRPEPRTMQVASDEAIDIRMPGAGLVCEFNGYIDSARCEFTDTDGAQDLFDLEVAKPKRLSTGDSTVFVELVSFTSAASDTTATVRITP